ncbi:MAG: AIR synthase-related protein, partial [Pyrinomonadaceae bacterium]
LNVELEKAVQEVVLRACDEGLLRSAHDAAEGGLAVALCECCFSSLNRERVGANIELKESLHSAAILFGETPSRIIISFDEADLKRIQTISHELNSPFEVIGRTGGEDLTVDINGQNVINTPVVQLEAAWRQSLSLQLSAQVMTANG